jgi:ribonuclease P protein component
MPCGDMNASKGARSAAMPERDVQSQVKASLRVSGLKLAATDETNLSTPQSSTQTHTRLSRPDGNTWRAQRAQTPSRQGPQTACDLDTAEATWLAGVAPPRPPSTFTVADRLHRRAEFLSVQRTGARSQSDHFVVYAAQCSETQPVRLGTTISRRVGNAVTRNRIRRRIRECFRLGLRLRFPAGTAVVVIGRAGAGALAMKSVLGELDNAVAKLRLYPPPQP